VRISSPSFLDDARLRRLFDALDGNGEELRVVGGAVRNHFMGKPVGEIDLATTAMPDVIIARANAAGLKSVPTGIDHGTVTVIVDHTPFEITTLREDVETDGRRAKVLFGRDFEKDALRRDFTFNALSVSADGAVHDYAGGMKDIETRHVRFIGDPATRIREDYLRILRYFRFHAAFAEGEADGAALAAIVANREGLDGLSRERVRAELIKLLGTDQAHETLALMSGLGLVMPLIGGVYCTTRLADMPRDAEPILKLAALAVLKSEDAARLQDVLRLSNAETQRLSRCAQVLDALRGAPAPNAQRVRELLMHFGRQAVQDACIISQAQARDTSWQAAILMARDLPEPKLPVGGADLMARGMKAGKAVGEALADIEKNWIAAGFPEDAQAVDALVTAALAACAK
jgi:poly(A) polymerase